MKGYPSGVTSGLGVAFYLSANDGPFSQNTLHPKLQSGRYVHINQVLLESALFKRHRCIKYW